MAGKIVNALKANPVKQVRDYAFMEGDALLRVTFELVDSKNVQIGLAIVNGEQTIDYDPFTIKGTYQKATGILKKDVAPNEDVRTASEIANKTGEESDWKRVLAEVATQFQSGQYSDDELKAKAAAAQAEADAYLKILAARSGEAKNEAEPEDDEEKA